RERLGQVELDLGDYRQNSKDYYEGKKLKKEREDWKLGLARVEEVLPAARKVGGPTRAAAALSALRMRLGGALVRQAVDADACVKLAEEAHRAAPSEATRSGLVSALTFRAHRRLSAAGGAYAAQALRTE